MVAQAIARGNGSAMRVSRGQRKLRAPGPGAQGTHATEGRGKKGRRVESGRWKVELSRRKVVPGERGAALCFGRRRQWPMAGSAGSCRGKWRPCVEGCCELRKLAPALGSFGYERRVSPTPRNCARQTSERPPRHRCRRNCLAFRPSPVPVASLSGLYKTQRRLLAATASVGRCSRGDAGRTQKPAARVFSRRPSAKSSPDCGGRQPSPERMLAVCRDSTCSRAGLSSLPELPVSSRLFLVSPRSSWLLRVPCWGTPAAFAAYLPRKLQRAPHRPARLEHCVELPAISLVDSPPKQHVG